MPLMNALTGQDYDTSHDQLASLPWSTLYQMRMQSSDPLVQAMISPYEHRAYAREQVQQNPLQAPLFAGALIPGYQAAKLAGLIPTDGQSSAPSWDQFTGGLTGVGEGLLNWSRGQQ